jgi:hypothetical protein
MNSNAVTAVWAVASMIVGAGISVLVMRHADKGARLTYKAEQRQHESTRAALEEVSAKLIAQFSAPVRQTIATKGGAVSPTLEAPPGNPNTDSALDLVVRARLGLLVDQNGKVSAARLIREVGRDTKANVDAILQSLIRLRQEGVVTWTGDGVDSTTEIDLYHSS